MLNTVERAASYSGTPLLDRMRSPSPPRWVAEDDHRERFAGGRASRPSSGPPLADLACHANHNEESDQRDHGQLHLTVDSTSSPPARPWTSKTSGRSPQATSGSTGDVELTIQL